MSLSSAASFFNKPDVGILLLRISVAVVMFMHGLPKYLGGAGTLEKVGGAMEYYGITFLPLLWGFLAATVETVGAVFIALGFVFRPTAFLMFFVLLTAWLTRMPSDPSLGNFGQFAHPMSMCLVFLSLLFIGPGRFAVQKGQAV